MLVWLEGFEACFNATDIGRKYPSVTVGGGLSFPNGQYSSRCWEASTTENGFRTQAFALDSTWIVGMRTWISFPSSCALMGIYHGGTEQIAVFVKPDPDLSTGITSWYYFEFRVGLDTLYRSSSFQGGGYHYLELKTKISSTNGEASLYMDGLPVMSIKNKKTSVTGAALADRVDFKTRKQSGGTFNIDDIYICNGSGSINIDLLGECVIKVTSPSEDGSFLEWAPLAGPSHFDDIDDTNADDESSYITTASVNVRDSFGLSQVTDIIGGVVGIQVEVVARLTASGVTKDIRALISHDDLEGQSGTMTVNSNAYDSYCQVMERDPITFEPWTFDDITNCELGLVTLS